MTERRDCVCPRVTHQHGTHNAYLSDNCRCPDCQAAHTQRTRQRRRQALHAQYGVCPPPVTWVSLVGTRRRLEALATLGWSSRDLAPLLGVAANMIEAWRSGRRYQRIRSDNAARLTELYGRVSDQPSPGRYALRTKNWATRMGFTPPIGWDDDTIDNPGTKPFAAEPVLLDTVAIAESLAGRRVQLTRRERSEAIRVGTAMGISATSIGQLLGASQGTIRRQRAA